MGHQLVSHLHIETAHKSHHTDASHLVWSQSQSQSHKGFPSHQKKKEELNLYHGEEGGREKGESRVQTRSVCGGGGDDGYQREHPHIVPSVQTYISFFFYGTPNSPQKNPYRQGGTGILMVAPDMRPSSCVFVSLFHGLRSFPFILSDDFPFPFNIHV